VVLGDEARADLEVRGVSLSVEDRLDIADVLVRYATGIDRRDWPLFRTCFSADCDADYGDIGHWRSVDEITDFMVMAHESAGHTQHSITNQAITATTTGATARSYVDSAVMSADGTSGIQAVGFYDDELVRGTGGWQIAKRHFTLVVMQALTNINPPRSLEP
jgi:3-phenylpropionate/cinnamic acid dioxygenase small subunit